MNFEDLSLYEKMAFINLAATLLSMKMISIKPEQRDEEEIIDAFLEPAKLLFNKSNLS